MNTELEHYKWMRKVVGYITILLPVLPILFGFIGKNNPPNWWHSISATYHTNANGVMVSMLAICGFTFCTYPGYDYRDRIINSLSGISLFGIIFVPCADPNLEITGPIGLFQLDASVSRWLHAVIALFLFITLFINIRFLFTKSSGEMTQGKKKRNLLYKITSYCIVPTSLIVLFAAFVFKSLPHWLVLVAEAIALIPCGIAWLVKGEAISALND